MSAPWPDHLLSLAEWDALPDDPSRRCELIEGVLVAVPRPAPLHQLAMLRLGAELDRQLPADLTALPDVEVVVDEVHPATVRAPDVVVVSRKAAEVRQRFDAADVLLAVEIISPGTGRTDRVTKFTEYAEAGIPAYWLIDLTAPVTLTAYVLVDGGYEVVAEGNTEIRVLTPAELAIRVDRLTAAK